MKQAASLLCDPSVRAQLREDSYSNRSQSKYVTLQKNAFGLSTFAACHIPAGTIVFRETGPILTRPTMHTIQIDVEKHLSFSGGAEFLAHHCDPNVKVDVDSQGWITVTALRPIGRGEMIAFNYLTTERSMSSPFQCLCGAPKCFGVISGYNNMDRARQPEIEALTTSVVKSESSRVHITWP